MNINDLRGLDRDEVLGWLGLERREATGVSLAKAFGVFGAGLVTGGAIALLFAPKAGRGLREDIRNRFSRSNGHAEVGPSAASEDASDESASARTPH